MNPFASRVSGNEWVLPVAGFSILLLVLMSLAWIGPVNLRDRSAYLSSDQARRLEASFASVPDEVKSLRGEVARLQEQLTKMQNAVGDKTKEAQVINEQLQNIKLFAGLTEVEGPGIRITLNDSSRAVQDEFAAQDATIHDEDVLKVVNELWASGAEAISINNLRASIGTSIRCVGPVILVDNVRVAPPIVIRAVGDPQVLEGGMSLPMGILDELRSVDKSMVEMQKVEKMSLPPYAGSTQRKIARTAAEKK